MAFTPIEVIKEGRPGIGWLSRDSVGMRSLGVRKKRAD
jgi:hypothetical protein